MSKVTTVGIDLAKNTFVLFGLGPKGHSGWKRKVRRKQLLEQLVRLEPCTVALEACGSSHYWARQIRALGHQVELLPPQHVKGYLRGQKNDYNDAQAIAEASEHGRIRPVPIKEVEQQDDQMLHKLRQGVSKDRVRISNQLRGLLAEYGVIMPQGIAALRRELPLALEDADTFDPREEAREESVSAQVQGGERRLLQGGGRTELARRTQRRNPERRARSISKSVRDFSAFSDPDGLLRSPPVGNPRLRVGLPP